MAVPSLKISSLVARSAGYVKANVAKANTNGNAFLTKAEAKALPKDLQDNYEAHRQGSQDNGVVTAQKFVEKYTDYVAINLSKADKNHDGNISKGELKYLPTDLHDNFWNAFNKR